MDDPPRRLVPGPRSSQPRHRAEAPRPYESPAPARLPPRVDERDPFLHAARNVRSEPIHRAGLSPLDVLRSLWVTMRLEATLARLTGTLRYRVRMVRFLRADVGAALQAPLRSLVDHGRREVLFDWDHFADAQDLARHPAVLDEARHIRERLGEEGR